MSLKVKVYSLMPGFVKRAMTRKYIALRMRREMAAAEKLAPSEDDDARVVYVTGFPRSGTTMLKYYFADYPGLRQTAFTPVGFFDAWKQAETSDEILVDKSNHYIYSLGSLFTGCGRGARVLIVVRDPRDCLVSFAKYQENREVPRDGSYWRYWYDQHADLLKFIRESGFGDLVYLVRYEDLVTHPEESKAAFLNWLGIEVEADDLDRSYRNDNPGEGWRDSVHDYREVGVHALQKWKKVGDDLPSWCRGILQSWKDDEDVVGMMNLLGYHEDGFGEPALPKKGTNLFRPAAQQPEEPVLC